MTFGSDGDTFWPGDNFILSNLVFEDADGTSNSSSNYEILWYRHPENTLSEASSPILLGGASGYTNYYATTDDIGSYISVKFQFTDDLGNLEFVDFTTDSAIQAAPNSPAQFDFALIHDENNFYPGEEFKIDPSSLTVSDPDGTSQSVMEHGDGIGMTPLQ